jgi:exportin-5
MLQLRKLGDIKPAVPTAKEASTYHPPSETSPAAPTYPTMRQFCLTHPAILEPLLIFCAHAIRMRDTRCCGVVLRVFRSLVPEFGISRELSPIREFISSEVLKACITSLHEPYFVDSHKELAQLIVSILVYYSSLTETPKQVLLSLPGMHENSVDKCVDYISRPGMAPKQQRAFVLDLLKDLKGVSISEQGRITISARAVRKDRSKMQMEFMKVEQEPPKSPDLGGVAALFDL